MLPITRGYFPPDFKIYRGCVLNMVLTSFIFFFSDFWARPSQNDQVYARLNTEVSGYKMYRYSLHNALYKINLMYLSLLYSYFNIYLSNI